MPTKQIQSIFDIAAHYDHYLVDIWGVVHDDGVVFAHVIETLQKLTEQGKQVVFLSNAPQRSETIKQQLIDKYKITSAMYHDVFTSGEDTYEHMMKVPSHYPFQDAAPYFFTGPLHTQLIADCKLKGTPDITQAGYIFNTHYDATSGIQGDALSAVLDQAIVRKLPMICTNPDTGVLVKGQYLLRSGTLAKMYADLGGVVHYHGKPYPSVYAGAMKKFSNFDRARTLAIGDTIATDIQGAHNFGIDSVLVLSGIERHFAPDKTVDEIVDGAEFRPTYCIDQLQ